MNAKGMMVMLLRQTPGQIAGKEGRVGKQSKTATSEP
jgi:hypothetical protein